MKKIKAIMFSLIMMFSLGAVPILASGEVNCPPGSVNYPTAKTYALCNVKKDESLIGTVLNIINVVVAVMGIVAVVMIILGGMTYTTSQGDAGKVKKAKDTILYGVIGLVVALLAFAIVNFVVKSVFGGGATTASIITDLFSSIG